MTAIGHRHFVRLAVVLASTASAKFSTASAMSAAASSSSRAIKSVAVSIAMEAEASPFVKHLGLTADDDFFPPEVPFRAFRGSHGECQLTVVTSGKDGVYGTGADNVGTVSAGLMTFLALQKLKNGGDGSGADLYGTGADNVGTVSAGLMTFLALQKLKNGGDGSGADLLINAGTSGGFKSKGAAVGDVFLTTDVANHDRRIPFPPFDVYGIGKVESAPVAKLAEEIGAKTGTCTTGNSIDKHDWDQRHMEENGAAVKDMEYAAIAWSAELNGVPHFGVKVVTDIVDGNRPTDEEFLENLHTAAESLQGALPKVIDYVCGKAHDEL
eukprot:CAMPEP_0197468304 /NCGR_PEP_ID=MMETSP1175-20131217/66015_1 /TAXON_ID=1003142 /ORGANISM="Triceratium dubium, Strain CCMP147" /LENGTH=325 /DNA_ID=CAMNT_0043004401 /DNA_START=20 /DNA_END=997 /DNA_ORIENTATION=-